MARRKYPRTKHLPWSLGRTSDDKVMASEDVELNFGGADVVVTEKLDGENTTIYSDGTCHARSLDSAHHPSRAWVKSLAAQVGPQLPTGWRICGENLFAEHSISYDALPSYFAVFSIWNDQNTALSWDETVEWCELLDLTVVPTLYEGPYDQEAIEASYTGHSSFSSGESEGYVVRVSRAFNFDDFESSLAKYVRPNHVQTDVHWMHSAVTPNGLA